MKKKLPSTPNIAPMTVSTGQPKESAKTVKTEQESINIESVKQENSNKDSLERVSTFTESSRQGEKGTQNQAFELSNLPERTKQLKTVTMRLTMSAADVLKALKDDTGLPNEILTDALIRHWADLPNQIQEAIVTDAKKIRAWRLVEGKRKSLETAQKNNAF